MLLNEQETRAIWDRVYQELRFRADSKYRGHSLLWWKRPFKLPKPWAVYALEDMRPEQIEEMAESCMRATGGGIGSAKKLNKEDMIRIYKMARE